MCSALCSRYPHHLEAQSKCQQAASSALTCTCAASRCLMLSPLKVLLLRSSRSRSFSKGGMAGAIEGGAAASCGAGWGVRWVGWDCSLVVRCSAVECLIS
jgi:hypothetical protein